MPRREEIAWAAGVFEGEGCVTEVAGRFTLKVNNTDEEVIRRFDEIVQLGRMYGPYKNSGNDGYTRRKPFWVWTAYEEDGLEVMQMLAPWLSERRLAVPTNSQASVFPCKDWRSKTPQARLPWLEPPPPATAA
jgi:hypothetical protein